MLGDTAVAVHPDPAARLTRCEAELDEKLAAAPAKEKPADRGAARRRSQRSRRTMLADAANSSRDMAAAGRDARCCRSPDAQIPLVADEWAKPELGTGCVKITPAHDPNDYEVGQRQPDIGAINILNPDGTLNENGRAVPRADDDEGPRERSWPIWTKLGLLVERSRTARSSWPTPTARRRRSSPTWPTSGSSRWTSWRRSAMDAVTDGRVKIIPERYAKSYLDWLSEKRDWPIGRQLWWGHRIPIWTKTLRQSARTRGTERSLQADHSTVAEAEGEVERCTADHEWDPRTCAGTAYLCLRDDDA